MAKSGIMRPDGREYLVDDFNALSPAEQWYEMQVDSLRREAAERESVSANPGAFGSVKHRTPENS